ncbi:DNA-methyltransferase [Roseovarius sp. B08]|uniref:DNA-methyltransferase n=1 Tax=Roseovarius sp. B08 TaxID=3449223 RepID=UPI003EDC837D
MTGIERDVIIGPCRLILGDMRDVLPKIEARADMIMSDPPYRLTSGGRNGLMSGCLGAETYDNSGALFEMVEWTDMAPLMFAAMADDSDAIIMTSDREMQDARAALQAAGFGFHRVLVWDKITATPNRWFMPDCEFGLYMWKGRARAIRDCSTKAKIRCPQRDVSQHYLPADLPPGERAAHPTEKPVPLMASWIANCTDPGGLVLDPFMGSGSTLVGAVRSRRRAIGIERDPKWFHVACERVREAVGSGEVDAPLFAAETAEQEGFAL